MFTLNWSYIVEIQEKKIVIDELIGKADLNLK